MVISFVFLVPACVFLSTDSGFVPREWLAGDDQKGQWNLDPSTFSPTIIQQSVESVPQRTA